MEIQFDHIGVISATLERGRIHLSSLLGIDQWTEEFNDPVNRVWVQFGRDPSGICYEIVAPLGEGSPISSALANGKMVLNHVAYLVPNLDEAAQRLRAAGSIPAGVPNPAVAYGGRRIQFLLVPLGFILEIIEAPDHRHQYGS